MTTRACPSFRYYHGRIRERDQIVNYFPTRCQRYIEPFAGAGNVFFKVISRQLAYESYLLNDINPFLPALTLCSMGEFPKTIDRKQFDKWAETKTPEAEVLSRAISYNGYGYEHGFIGATSYNRAKLVEDCWSAKTMLKKADIQADLWVNIPYDDYTEDDFVYFDPPMRHDKLSKLIDYDSLLQILHHAPFKWVLTHAPDSRFCNELGAYKQAGNYPLYIWRNFDRFKS